MFECSFNGNDCFDLVKKLFPIHRSLTGNGFRKSLNILKEYLPDINIFEVKSGTKVFDWTIPKEWNCTQAYIEDEHGERIIDIENSNLHVLGYSLPMDEYLSLENLKKIIYTQPDQKDAIPYVTSYYKERSGFCMSQNQLDFLKDGKYHAVIKSTLENGSLTYGELIIKGKTDEEILISTYLCHPSMANNECSGPAVSVALAKYIKKKNGNHRYTYRFIFIPETIGSITYLSRNLDYLKKHVKAGFVLSCVGDDNAYSAVHSRYGNTLTDRVIDNTFKSIGKDTYKSYSYLYRGSDERQFNAPGVDLPVCAVCRSKYGMFKEYHTSLDNLDYVSAKGLEGALNGMIKVIEVLEHDYKYQIQVLCEPQLGKRNLYPTLSCKGSYASIQTMTNFIAYADGTQSLLDISERIFVPAYALLDTVNKLLEQDLLKIVE